MKSNSELTERVTVVVVTYNHAKFIDKCLRSTLAENPAKVIVVDSGSTDGTIDIVQERFPDVTLLTPEGNRGYGAGNNFGVKTIDTEYTIILNPDTRVEPGSLDLLLAPLAERDRLITTPKILTYDGSRINTCGNIHHFTGLGFTRGLHRPSDDLGKREYVSGVSGACFGIRTDLYRDIGGFDESFFMYMEDVELSWRAALHDVDILYVPEAIIHHDFEDVSVPSEKIYHVERGRYYILRKHFDRWTALSLLPSLLVTEILTCGYAVLNGPAGIRNKIRAMRDGFTMDVEPISKNPQKILVGLATQIPEDQLTYSSLDQFGKRVANAVYRFNHRLVRE